MKRDAVAIRCVDVIARFSNAYVVVERLSHPQGLAFPGGKIESGESTESAAMREFAEETGLSLAIERSVGLYDSEGRDPRGLYISVAFRGIAYGKSKSEVGKTRVLLLSRSEIESRSAEFIADHFQMFCDYVKQGV